MKNNSLQSHLDQSDTTPSGFHPTTPSCLNGNELPRSSTTPSNGRGMTKISSSEKGFGKGDDDENSPSFKKGCPKGGVVLKYSPIHSTELPYNSDLKERARELRKAGNLPEIVFWKVVKNKQIFGLDFDRQKIIGNFIVDFYCTKLALIIEIDESSYDEKYEYDMEREVYLRSLGLKILRFTVRDIMDNLSGVVEYLEEYILREYS